MKKLTITGLILLLCGLLILVPLTLSAWRNPLLAMRMLQNSSFLFGSGSFGIQAPEWRQETLSFEPSSIESVNIKLASGQFELRCAEVEKPSLSFSQASTGQPYYRIAIKDKCLSISGDFNKYRSFFPSFFKSKDFVPSPVVLTLPRGTKLNTLNIKLNLGALELENLDADSLQLQLNAGDCRISKLRVGYLDAELNMGNLRLSQSEILKSGELEADMGNIEFSGLMKGQQKISCALGNIKLNLAQKEALSLWEAKVALGSLKVNGHTLDGKVNAIKSKENHFQKIENEMEIKCNMGNVEITFTE